MLLRECVLAGMFHTALCNPRNIVENENFPRHIGFCSHFLSVCALQ